MDPTDQYSQAPFAKWEKLTSSLSSLNTTDLESDMPEFGFFIFHLGS